MEHGSEVSVVVSEEIMHVIEEGSLDEIDCLIKKVTDYDEVSMNFLWGLIHTSALFGRCDLLEILFEKITYFAKEVDVYDFDKDGWTPLHYAAKGGQLETIKYLIEKGADVNAQNFNGAKYFHIAASYGKKEIIDFFLKEGGKMNEVDYDRWTVLHYAAKGGNIDVVEFLVDNNADIYASSFDGKKPLHVAASYGHETVVRFLIDKGMDIDVVDKRGWAPLHYAAEKGFNGLVQLLSDRNANLYVCSSNGYHAIHHAAKNGHKKTVEIFLEKGVVIDYNSNNCWTSLHYAALNGHLELVQLLVDKGANIHARTNDGAKAIHSAALNGHKDIVKYFLCKRMSIDEYTYQNWTPLHVCVQKSQIEMVEFLVQNNANVNAKTAEGLSVLHLAAKFGQMDIIKFFLNRGFDVNECCKKGWTPLHYAAFNGSMNVINFLLERYAKCDKFDFTYIDSVLYVSVCEGHINAIKTLVEFGIEQNSITPINDTLLPCATEKGYLEIVKYLFENGAAHVKNSEGVKPIHIAAQKGYKSIVEYFLDKGVCIDDTDEEGWTPLHYAIRSIHSDLVKCLINRGSNVKARSKYGASVLCIASLYRPPRTDIYVFRNKENFIKLCNRAKTDHLEILDVLIQNGGLINDDFCDGWTPLHFAFYNIFGVNVDHIVKKLIDTGAELNAQNKNGKTPLHIAAEVYNINAIKILLDAKPNLNICDENGDTPLHIACKNQKLEIVKLLLEAGARSDIKDNNGRTVCFYLIQSFMDNVELNSSDRVREFCRILEKISVFIDIDSERNSALHLALGRNCNFWFMSCVLCLQGNVNVMNISGDTPLNLVTEKLSSWVVPMSFAFITMFIYSGGYFNTKDCQRIVANRHIRNVLFSSKNLCTKSILNRLNYEYLPKLYNSSLSTNLPPIDRLKLNILDSKKIEKSVKTEISKKGFCDVSKMMSSLALLSVICLANHC